MEFKNVIKILFGERDAYIIPVDGEPLSNISNVRRVATVIKDGKIHDPIKLHAMAGF